MDKVLKNYQKIFTLAETDLEYRKLEEAFAQSRNAVLSLLDHLPNSDREALLDYLGAYSTMELRMVELACFHMIFPE